MKAFSPSSQPIIATSRDAKVTMRAPHEALLRHVQRIFIVESLAARSDFHLPDTGAIAAFSYQGDCLLSGRTMAPRAAITGLTDTLRGHTHSSDHAVIIVAFATAGAGLLLRPPLGEFTNVTLDLGTALGRPVETDRLHDQLTNATSHDQRFALVENFLCRFLNDANFDPLTSIAVQLIEKAHGRIHIKGLAKQIGLSQSALERRFHRFVGVAPRKFASLVRLRTAVRLRAAGHDLITVAHEAGYFDQSHFIRDFRRFAGIPPGTFLP
jgi:AraC-like DNA-binding protein